MKISLNYWDNSILKEEIKTKLFIKNYNSLEEAFVNAMKTQGEKNKSFSYTIWDFYITYLRRIIYIKALR